LTTGPATKHQKGGKPGRGRSRLEKKKKEEKRRKKVRMMVVIWFGDRASENVGVWRRWVI
jgi:hypothetical protein